MTKQTLAAHPNPASVSRKPTRLGMFLGAMSPPAWEIALGIYATLHDSPDWDIARIHGRMLLNTSDLNHGDVDAAILEIDHPDLPALLREKKIRAVVVNNLLPQEEFSVVNHDERAIAALAAEAFWKMGLKNYAFYGLRQYNYAAERWRGYQHWLGRKGIEARAWKDGAEFYRLVHTREYLGRLGSWLKAFRGPVGVFAANNIMANNVIEAALAQGLRVPEDVAVIGVKDFQSTWLDIRLSCVVPDLRTMGKWAAECLLRGEDSRREHKTVPPIGLEENQSSALVKPWDQSVRLAVDAIHSGLHQPLGIEDIVSASGTSRRNLERRFQKVLGRSIHRELTLQRVERAKELLRQPGRLIRDVSQSVGFPEQRHLSVLFQSELGMTPKEYRESIARKGETPRSPR